MAGRKKKIGRVWLWVLTAVFASAVLGRYVLDHRPQPVSIGPREAVSRPDVTGILDLNTATARELEDLPGIGPALAERIIAWREENGPFAGPEDVMAVQGIGPATYEALAPYIEFTQGSEP